MGNTMRETTRDRYLEQFQRLELFGTCFEVDEFKTALKLGDRDWMHCIISRYNPCYRELFYENKF